MSRCIGILTSGGDCPGLNAAIRGVGKADVTFGFDTALGIATEAIDRLHSTATSHHRIVVEIMGHRAGWLALGVGVAGGADVILIPEIPYSIEKAAEAITLRSKKGKRFSIVAVAEGAIRRTGRRPRRRCRAGAIERGCRHREARPYRSSLGRIGTVGRRLFRRLSTADLFGRMV